MNSVLIVLRFQIQIDIVCCMTQTDIVSCMCVVNHVPVFFQGHPQMKGASPAIPKNKLKFANHAVENAHSAAKILPVGAI